MKKSFIAIALAAAIPVAVFAASDHKGPRHQRGPNVERMAEQLDLSAEQQERIRALFESHKAEREALREKMRAGMAEVLTPEQQARMETLRDERREKRMERRKHRRHGERGKDCAPEEGADKS